MKKSNLVILFHQKIDSKSVANKNPITKQSTIKKSIELANGEKIADVVKKQSIFKQPTLKEDAKKASIIKQPTITKKEDTVNSKATISKQATMMTTKNKEEHPQTETINHNHHKTVVAGHHQQPQPGKMQSKIELLGQAMNSKGIQPGGFRMIMPGRDNTQPQPEVKEPEKVEYPNDSDDVHDIILSKATRQTRVHKKTIAKF